MNKKWSFVFLILMILLPSQAYSWSWTPLQVSVWEPVQLFPERFNVYGIRMNLAYGNNQNLTGLDAGVVNVISDKHRGGQLGLINLSEDSLGVSAGGMNYTTSLYGGQFGLVNTAQKSLSGLQAAGLMNLSDHIKGIQLHAGILGNGAVDVDGAQVVCLLGYNLTDDVNGVQAAAFGFNYANETVNGVQVAMLYNYANKINGLQLGLINACEHLTGVQIGLVNIVGIEKMSIMPIMNFRF
jgi:hypothetical protein